MSGEGLLPTTNEGVCSRAMRCSKMIVLLVSLLPMSALSTPSTTAVAEAGKWQASDTALARVRARRQAELSLPFVARVNAITVEPGVPVAVDDVLLSFDAPLLRQHLAAWQQASLEVQLAQKRLRVLRQSESQHAITRRELLAGEQAVVQAQGKARMRWETLAAELDLLHVQTDKKHLATQLQNTGLPAVARSLGILRAPFAGLVMERQVALGEQVAAGQPLLELEALENVYLDVGLPESKLATWREGTAHWRDGNSQGKLGLLAGVARYDASSGLWLLRYRAANPDYRLRDGAWIEVVHRAVPRDVVWVPAVAVVARNRKTWCVVREGGQFKPVEVKVGPAVAERIPVISGLVAGDKVVTTGAYELLYRDLKELIKFVD